jgi:hypothetical protein
MNEISSVKESGLYILPLVYIQDGNEEIPLQVQQNTIMTIKEGGNQKVQVESNREIGKIETKGNSIIIEANLL